jgi:hypothetical protein
MAIQKIAPSLSPADVLDRVLDKGIVIEAEIRIAVVGIELVTVSALVRVASFETWDRYVATRARQRSKAGHAAPASETNDTHRVRLRCEDGCTFERRASTLVIRAGVFARQRCAIKTRRECAITVL